MPIKAPWRLETRAHCFAVVDASGQEVAFIDLAGQADCGSTASRGRTAEELHEIARLIEAAPTLLGALRCVAAMAPRPGGVAVAAPHQAFLDVCNHLHDVASKLPRLG